MHAAFHMERREQGSGEHPRLRLAPPLHVINHKKSQHSQLQIIDTEQYEPASPAILLESPEALTEHLESAYKSLEADPYAL